MGKREDFKKGLAVLGVTGVVAATGFMGKALDEQRDMSKYNVADNKYEDYIKNDADKKILEKLDENISKYEELKSKSRLNSSEKEELENVTEDLKRSMSSGYLGDFYLKNVLKGKLKNAYNVEKIETRYRNEDDISIKLFDKYGNYELMDSKDKIMPIKNAMRDIATLQGYEENKNFSKSEINNFIKIYKNMKGFSNVELIKKEGNPLTYAVINIDKDKENSLE